MPNPSSSPKPNPHFAQAAILRARTQGAAFLVLLFFLSGFPLFAWPPIRELSSLDPVFGQFEGDVARSRLLLARGADSGELISHLALYSWTSDGSMDLMSVSARCTIPYDSLASLNRISRNGPVAAGTVLLLPSVPGLWIFPAGEEDLDRLLLARLSPVDGPSRTGVALSLPGIGPCTFFPGEDFNATERAFFLNTAFRFPLPAGRLTSDWGYRSDPFTGKRHFHRGIDLAAPVGTEVYATRDGVVSFVGEDRIYGRYIVITHENGWSSLYGHFSKIETSLHKRIRSGSIIGRVGSTGLSTGPHLHFEIRRNGDARNPGELLPKGF